MSLIEKSTRISLRASIIKNEINTICAQRLSKNSELNLNEIKLDALILRLAHTEENLQDLLHILADKKIL